MDITPSPQISLVRISVCNQVSNRNSYQGEPVVGAETAPHSDFQDFHSLSKGKIGFLSKNSLLPQPESDGKPSVVGVGGRIGILKLSLSVCTHAVDSEPFQPCKGIHEFFGNFLRGFERMQLFCLQLGSFLPTLELFYLQLTPWAFSTRSWSFFAYSFSFFDYSWSFFAYSGKVRLIRALSDCKQRSLTVSKKAPTVSRGGWRRSPSYAKDSGIFSASFFPILLADRVNSSPPPDFAEISGIRWNLGEFGEIQGNFGESQGNSVEFSGGLYALSMNSVGFLGDFGATPDFRENLGFGMVWDGFG